MSIRLRFRSRTIAGLLGAVAIGAVASAYAQFAPPPVVIPPSPPAPSAPTDLSPTAGTYEGKVGNLTPLTLMWSQYFPTGISLNPRANYFVICFDPSPGASPPPCTVSTADWTETIAAPSAALSRVGGRFTFNPGRYIAAAELDRPMRLTVGACTQLATASCRFTGVALYYSSVNPVASTTGTDEAFTSGWKLNVRATSSGTSAVPQFNGTVEYWEVLGTGSPGRTCRTDVDAMEFRTDMTVFAIDRDGLVSLVAHLPHPYTGPLIRGIYRLGDSYDMAAFTTSDPAIGASQSNERGIGFVTFPVATAGGQRTFVVVSRLDSGGAIVEFNETDNATGQCKTR